MKKVRHIVSWNLKDGCGEEEALQIKKNLESLKEPLNILELKVYISNMKSSDREVVLNSLFESEEALETYQSHPLHVESKNYISSVTKDRICLDYFE